MDRSLQGRYSVIYHCVLILSLCSMIHHSQPVADREFKIEAATFAAAWTADTITTHYWVTHCPNCVEGGGLWNGSRSTPKIMASWALVDVAAVIVSYEWKKRVTNRYLHPLWRVPMLVGSEEHTRSSIHNLRNLPLGVQ